MHAFSIIDNSPETFIFKDFDKTLGFCQIPNKIKYSKHLDMNEKSVLEHLIGKPSGWRIILWKIAEEMGKGIDFIRKQIKKLQEKGYIFRRRVRKSGKFASTETYVSISPIFPKNDDISYSPPRTCLPRLVAPGLVKPTLYKDRVDKERAYKEKGQQQETPLCPSFEAPLTSEIGLTSECDIIVPAAAFLGSALEEGSNMGVLKEVQCVYEESPRRLSVAEATAIESLEEIIIQDDIEDSVVKGMASTLRGRVSFKELISYVGKYGRGKVLDTIALVLKRGIFSKDNPNGYFAVALRDNWAGDGKASKIEEMEAKEVMATRQTFTHEQNIAWWDSLIDAQKQARFSEAAVIYPVIEVHFSAPEHSISVLDKDFSTNTRKRWMFCMLMEVLGRQKARDISV